VLKQHCDKLERDYDSIVKSTGATVFLLENDNDAERETAQARGTVSLEEYSKGVMVGTPAQIVERLQMIADAGADYFIIYIPRVAYNQEPLQRFAKEVLPHVS
jgi:alkanesulfonate monooxygenase SsuD/methylene tetrahydromethanopterin reductase-like flavin-dependent oxidoreductase (luciferase family)